MKRITPDRFLSDVELDAFMAAVRARRHKNQPRDHAFFALLANTGIRPSEALALTRSDVRLGRMPSVMLRRPRKRHAPEPVNRLIINTRIAQVLAVHARNVPDGAPLFPFTRRQSQRLFHYYARRAGIRTARVYALRHTAGVRLWRHTHDVRMLQAVMGHVGLGAARAYAHVSPSQVEAAVNAVGTVL